MDWQSAPQKVPKSLFSGQLHGDTVLPLDAEPEYPRQRQVRLANAVVDAQIVFVPDLEPESGRLLCRQIDAELHPPVKGADAFLSPKM